MGDGCWVSHNRTELEFPHENGQRKRNNNTGSRYPVARKKLSYTINLFNWKDIQRLFFAYKSKVNVGHQDFFFRRREQSCSNLCFLWVFCLFFLGSFSLIYACGTKNPAIIFPPPPCFPPFSRTKMGWGFFHSVFWAAKVSGGGDIIWLR